MTHQEDDLPVKKIVLVAVSVCAAIAACFLMGGVGETVGADEIVVKQGAIDGHLTVWSQPGFYGQWFGSMTRYRKSEQFWFSADKKEGGEENQAIKVRFNDGGHANVSGSLRFDLPLDDESVKKLHIKFGSNDAIRNALIRTVVVKSVYMTGPLLSSKESYAEKRSSMIQYIDDQIVHGIYQTSTQEVTAVDPLSGKDKTVTQVTLKQDVKSSGGFARQEASAITEFGIRVYNVSINDMVYDEAVEAQIKSQQAAIANVQTAMAQSKKAEQDAITTMKQGEASAAKAKWEQETLKAKAVTEGEQEKAVAVLKAEKQRDVAKLALDAAEFTKKEQIALGEGEATRKRLVMQADGALTAKLAAYVETQKTWADAYSKQRQVPEVVLGGSASPSTSFMDLLGARAARELALDFKATK